MKSLKTAYELLAGATRATPPSCDILPALPGPPGTSRASSSAETHTPTTGLHRAFRQEAEKSDARRAFQNYGCMVADFALEEVAGALPHDAHRLKEAGRLEARSEDDGVHRSLAVVSGDDAPGVISVTSSTVGGASVGYPSLKNRIRLQPIR
jgi:hypothetical protein